MASYTLTYLDYRGRAELVRFIFAQAGVEYVDKRISPTEWPSIRSTTPLGIVPVLEIDGKPLLSGNCAIARYLAEKFGLAGSGDEVDKAAVMGIVEAVEEVWVKLSQYFWEKDETKKADMKQALLTQHLPCALTFLEKYSQTNGCGEEGWVHGKEVTYADFSVCVLLETLTSEAPSVLDKLPSLKKLKDSVEGLPNIQKWLKTRPDTTY